MLLGTRRGTKTGGWKRNVIIIDSKLFRKSSCVFVTPLFFVEYANLEIMFEQWDWQGVHSVLFNYIDNRKSQYEQRLLVIKYIIRFSTSSLKPFFTPIFTFEEKKARVNQNVYKTCSNISDIKFHGNTLIDCRVVPFG